MNKNIFNSYYPAMPGDEFSGIIDELRMTLKIGILSGMIGIIGYSVCISNTGWRLLFLLILLALASFMSGFFLGILFGIPKRVNDADSSYNLSNNLIDISDWLTKIIVGLGLIEIKKLPELFLSIATFIQQSTNGESSIKVVSICCIIYFSVFGLYFGYNYMRLVLSRQYKTADDILMKKKEELKIKGEELKKIDFKPDGDNDNNDTSQKVKDYNELLKTLKTEGEYDFNDWYYKGIAAYSKKDYNKTITYMNNALEKDSNNVNAPNAYLYNGICYSNLGLYDQAIDVTSKAKKFNDYVSKNLLYYNISIYYSKLEKFQEALTEVDTSISLNPNDDLAYSQKGYCLFRLDRFEEAKVVIDKALALNPNLTQAWYDKATIAVKLNDKQDMLQSLKRSFTLDESFKNVVKTDPVFKDYLDDEEFKAVVDGK